MRYRTLGFVSLVGAGPGDADLLTIKAWRRLQSADTVLHDALVSDDVLALAPQARIVLVGRRAGCVDRYDAAVDAMISGARRGEHVVRLKGGDPFVFGRGGEEALALAAANVPFEVVPGVSAVIAAPALAGIPLTLRHTASGFAVITGHDLAVCARLIHAIEPASLTLVVVMGFRARRALVRTLIDRGWPAATPSAIVAAASSPDQAVWRGSLADLADASVESTVKPALIVIGDVVQASRPIAAAAEEDYLWQPPRATPSVVRASHSPTNPR
jgi:uroporphyrin-III C-methyltransferase